jgi:predicted P-loop ATPase
MIAPETTTLRLQLRKNGFHTLPLEGKVPHIAKWQEKFLNTSEDEIRLWPKTWHLAANTGVLAKFAPGLDIDIMIEAAAEAVELLARTYFEERGDIHVRFGKPPKRLIPLRTDEPFEKLFYVFKAPDGSEHKIEMLGDGQQYVVDGIHPDTHQPYGWFGGNLATIKREDLPDTRLDDAKQFINAARKLLEEDFGFVVTSASSNLQWTNGGGGPHDPGEDPQADPELIADALAVIPNNADWDRWYQLGMAVWRATGGSADGFTAWDTWSKKSPKYDARNTAQKWAAFFKSPPTKIGAGTIFHLADQASPNWRKPWRKEQPATEAEIERLAKLSRVDYDREREAAAEKLGIRLTTLDELVEEKKTPKPKPGEKEYMTVFSDLACNVGNVLLALNQEPGLMNAFGYDEMLRTEVLLRPLRPEQNFKVRPVTDADVTAVQSWLQWYGFRGLGKDAAHDAINKHARDHAFHPVRDYLNGLCWNGTPRLRTWLHEYLGAEENKYIESIGTMFLIGMVARIFQPGCKFDYMPILEGEQGLYKSKACSILAGPEYFSDQLPDIKSKEASQHLRGKWLIEVAELSTYSRAEVDDFKAFLTRQVERYRPPWGRKEVHEPRQNAFIGTTNKVHYFRDETGNRRFWPATTGVFKLDKLHNDRDQLFAEAVKLFRDKVNWWPDREFEQRYIAPEQESRYQPDVWEPLIRKHLDALIEQALKAQPSYLPRTTILDIAIKVLGFTTSNTQQQGEIKTPISRLEPKIQGRISAVLTHLHWVPKRTKHERWWEPGPKVLSEA